jgi:hypothetical protein
MVTFTPWTLTPPLPHLEKIPRHILEDGWDFRARLVEVKRRKIISLPLSEIEPLSSNP